MSERALGIGFFVLAVAAVLLSQSVGLSALLLYFAPLAVIIIAAYAYGLIVLFPVAALIVAVWLVS